MPIMSVFAVSGGTDAFSSTVTNVYVLNGWRFRGTDEEPGFGLGRGTRATAIVVASGSSISGKKSIGRFG